MCEDSDSGEPAEEKDTVERIIDAALEMVEQEGAAAISMRSVAKAAGLATGTVTYHFPYKEELIECCLDRFYVELEVLREEFVPKLMQPGEPKEVTEECVKTLFRWAVKNRTLNRLRVQSTFSRGQRDPMRFHRATLPLLQVAETLLPRISPHSPEQCRIFIHTLSNNMARSIAECDDELVQVTKAETLEQAFDLMEQYYCTVAKLYLFGSLDQQE